MEQFVRFTLPKLHSCKFTGLFWWFQHWCSFSGDIVAHACVCVCVCVFSFFMALLPLVLTMMLAMLRNIWTTFTFVARYVIYKNSARMWCAQVLACIWFAFVSRFLYFLLSFQYLFVPYMNINTILHRHLYFVNRTLIFNSRLDRFWKKRLNDEIQQKMKTIEGWKIHHNWMSFEVFSVILDASGANRIRIAKYVLLERRSVEHIVLDL